MDPSGYCHRKLGGAQGLSLPPGTQRVPSLSLPPSCWHQSAFELPPDFLLSGFALALLPPSLCPSASRLPGFTPASASLSQLRLRTLKTAQVGAPLPSDHDFRSLLLTFIRVSASSLRFVYQVVRFISSASASRLPLPYLRSPLSLLRSSSKIKPSTD